MFWICEVINLRTDAPSLSSLSSELSHIRWKSMMTELADIFELLKLSSKFWSKQMFSSELEHFVSEIRNDKKQSF